MAMHKSISVLSVSHQFSTHRKLKTRNMVEGEEETTKLLDYE